MCVGLAAALSTKSNLITNTVADTKTERSQIAGDSFVKRQLNKQRKHEDEGFARGGGGVVSKMESCTHHGGVGRGAVDRSRAEKIITSL